MHRLHMIMALLAVLVLLIGAGNCVNAEERVDLLSLEGMLRSGMSSPKDVQLMLDNAWMNGYDHCNISLSEDSDSFVIEVAVRGLVSSLEALSQSEDEQGTELFMRARDVLLSHCCAVIEMIGATGEPDCRFSFVLLDDVKVLQGEYSAGADVATIIVSEGQVISVESIWSAWNAPVSEMSAVAAVSGAEAERTPTYILNVKTKKFHIPSCDSVNKMNEENKKEFFGTRDEAVSAGYAPCGSCNP